MKHIILGSGNLGMDLFHELGLNKNNRTAIYSRSTEMKATVEGGKLKGDVNEYDIANSKPDVVWCTFGNGGPCNNPMHSIEQFELLHNFPLRLAKALQEFSPHTKLVLFSTHYLNEKGSAEKSLYAMAKRSMEMSMASFKNVITYRVGSLYGVHKPATTLPGKIYSKFLDGQTTFLASLNMVTPTPTEWLAKVLVEQESWMQDHSVMSIGPSGYMTIHQWINEILEMVPNAQFKVIPNGVDSTYPVMSISHCENTPHASHLWSQYGQNVLTSLGRSLNRYR